METSKTIITVSAAINAPVEKVWQYWTTPRHIIRWNNASDDWCTLKAENDLKAGGTFTSIMAAKDGSFSFDFSGIYDAVIENKLIEYAIADGRKVKVVFSQDVNNTIVTEEYEAESTHSHEMQKAGWQAILNNFKKYVESSPKNEILFFSIAINVPSDKVYDIMLEDATYREWTSVFNPTSYFEGSWEKGTKMLFLGTDQEGNKGGMVSRIRENIRGKYISIEHIGMVKGEEEITIGPEVESWVGILENYTFKEGENEITIVEVDIDSNEDFKEYFSSTWPKALEKLKSICENII